jgi:hypothetical protein
MYTILDWRKRIKARLDNDLVRGRITTDSWIENVEALKECETEDQFKIGIILELEKMS